MTPDAELNAYLAALTPGRVDYIDTDTGKLATIYTPPECTASVCCGKTVHAEHRDDCPQHPVPASPAAPGSTQGTNVAAGASGGESGAERPLTWERLIDALTERNDARAERDAARAEVERLMGVIDSLGYCDPSGLPIKACSEGPCDCGYEGVFHRVKTAEAELARVTESDAHHRRACSAKAGQLARVTAVHAEYFDMEVDPWDACPAPEDVWRYDRDFRAALLAPTEGQS